MNEEHGCELDLQYSRSEHHMDILNREDKEYLDIRERFCAVFDRLTFLPQQLLNRSKPFSYILETTTAKFKKQNGTNPTLSTLEKQLQYMKEARETMGELLQGDFCGAFVIISQKLQDKLFHRISKLQTILFALIKKQIEEENENIKEEVKRILETITKTPENIEELDEIQTFIKNLKIHMLPINEKIRSILDKMGVLEDHQHRLSDFEFSKTWFAFAETLQISKARKDIIRKLDDLKKILTEELRKEIAALKDDIEDMGNEFELIERHEDLANYEETGFLFEELGERIEKAIYRSEVINRREHILQFKNTNYKTLFQLKKKYTPFASLWQYVSFYYDSFPGWMSGSLINIDRDSLTNSINTASDALKHLMKADFKDKLGAREVTSQIYKLFEHFKPYLPLICDLRNPGLQTRHFENISKITGIELNSELRVTLQELLDKGILNHKEEINEISDFASKERNFEAVRYKYIYI